MATYTVDFTSLGTETSPSIPGKTSISLPANTINSAATSLQLTGQGVSLYGQIQQDNFIKLLENFASKTAPAHPTIGQVWFDSVNNLLKVYDMSQTWADVGRGLFIQSSNPSTAIYGQLWFNTTEQMLYLKVDPASVENAYPRYFDGTWVQVWPARTSIAYITEYNALAARINRVVGAPSVFGSDPDVANNQYGWGETDLLPIYSSANSPLPFDNNAFIILIARLMKATLHEDQSLSPRSAISKYGFISDGRGDNNATAISYVPSVTWAKGWGGVGIYTEMNVYPTILTAITNLETNRFTINTSDTTWTVIDTTTRPSWNQTKVYDASIQFGSAAAAKEFFNAAGQLRFNISLSGGGTSLYTAWNNLFTNTNTFVNDYTTAGFCIDYKGCRRGPTGAYIGGSSSIGYYDLTTSYQTLLTVSRGGAYGAGSLTFEAKTSTTGGWTVDVQITFTEDLTIGSPSVDGTTSVALQVRHPTGAVSGDPTINTPAIAVPTVTTSGTFKTAPAE